jgi:PAS domain S-box-containing protein
MRNSHASLAVAVDAIRELIEQTYASRCLDAETRRALLFARDGVALLWDALLMEHESREQYERDCVEVFESSPDGCVLTDLNATVRRANRAAAQLLGVSAAQLVRKPLTTYLVPEECDAMPGYLLELIVRGGQTGPLRWRTVLRGTAARVQVQASVTEMGRAGGALTGLCWSFRPVAPAARERREAPLDAEIAVPERPVGVERG